MIQNDERLVALFNKIINSDDPESRVQMGKEIASDIGRWLMCPSVLMEQLLAKLEQEVEFIGSRKAQHPIIEAMRLATMPEAEKIVALLQVFLEVRPQMRDTLRKRFPAVASQIPE